MDCVPSFGPRAYIASWPLFRQRLLCGPDISRGHLTKRPVPTITNALSPSSIRLGRRPLKPLRRVQIPLVTPSFQVLRFEHVQIYVQIAFSRGAKGTTFAPFFFAKAASILSGCTPRLLIYRAVVLGFLCRSTACTEGISIPS